VLVHPDGGAEQLQATPRVPTQRTGPLDAPTPARPRHAAPEPSTAEYPSLPPQPASAQPVSPPPFRGPAAPEPGPTAGRQPSASYPPSDGYAPTAGYGRPGAEPPQSSGPVRSNEYSPASEPGPTAGYAPTAGPVSAPPVRAASPTPAHLQVPVIHPPHPALHDETMVLPAFLTGKIELPPEPEEVEEPAPNNGRPDPAAKLPATERGMLIFVAALLGIGTIAVVAVMGMGLASPKKPSTPPAPTSSASGTAAAIAGNPDPVVDPVPSGTGSLRPTERPSSSGPKVLGSIASVDILRTYCQQWRNDAYVVGPGQPGPSSPTWACVDPHAKRPSDATLQAAPNYVCRWKYRDNSSYSPSQGSDKLPWTCYT